MTELLPWTYACSKPQFVNPAITQCYTLSMTSAALILIFMSQALMAQEKCSPQQLLTKVCDHFQSNSKSEFLKTSNGQKIKNPFYRVPEKNPNLDNTVQELTEPEGPASEVDRLLNFQTESEEFLVAAAPHDWSKKTKMALVNPNNMLRLLIEAFPDDDELTSQIFKLDNVYLPESLTDPKSKAAAPTNETFVALKNGLGKENLEGLLKIYKKNYPKTHFESGVSVKNTTPEPPAAVKEVDIKESKARQARLFAHARISVENMIKNGRPDTALSEEERNLLQRIASIKIQFAESDDAKYATLCKKKETPAFFNGDDKDQLRVFICPELLEFPDATIVSVLGHEIGHSVDTCSTSYPLENGKLKPIPLEKHPLSSVRTCLLKTGKFQAITDEEIRESVEMHVKSYQKTGLLDSEEIEVMRASLTDRFSARPECAGTVNKKSEMRESLSDVAASYAVARYVKEYPPKNFNDFIGTESFFFTQVCDPDYKTNEIKRAENLAYLAQDHASAYNRLTQVYLSFPGLAAGAGCQVHQTNGCFQRYGTVNSSTPAETTRPQIENQKVQQ